jgi:hypothetical protein
VPGLPAPDQGVGKVESGVKYLKGNFLPGRLFIDQVDFEEPLAEWNATIADRRLHGTTHERPIERFAQERGHRVPLAALAPFRLGSRLTRRVAEDDLISLDTNRYSVPCTLIGQTVEVERGAETVQVYHRGTLVASHPRLEGTHRLVILPEHGPGALARNPGGCTPAYHPPPPALTPCPRWRSATWPSTSKASAEGHLEEKLKLYKVPRLLIVDEIGSLPIERQGANLVFQLVSRRYERGPMILTSNQSFAAWGEVFGERLIATAMASIIIPPTPSRRQRREQGGLAGARSSAPRRR